MDDVQDYSTEADMYGSTGTYETIKVFVKKQYVTALQNVKYFWLCIDVMQGTFNLSGPSSTRRRDITSENSSLCLLYGTTGARRALIPTIQLKKILRNSSGIIPVIRKGREETVDVNAKRKLLPRNIQLGKITPGHNITGEPVL